VDFAVSSSGGTPTGNVRVTVSGSDVSCTDDLSGGTGSCQLLLASPGDYTLTATYSGGASFAQSSGTNAHVVATALPPPNQPPTAAFSAPNCTAGQPCRFNDGSTDTDGDVVAWNWNFGPGGTSTERNPSPTFPSAGTFDVTLTVTDNDGDTGDVTHAVTVEAPPPASTNTRITDDTPDPSVSGSDVTVSFTVNSNRGTPTGGVTVSDGTDSCSGILNQGSGSCQLTLSTVGDRTLTATYSGAGAFAPSSDTARHRVEAPAPATTSTRITGDDPDPTDPGQSFTVAFEVTSNAGTPTGSVTVTDGSQNCSGDLVNGQGSCSLALTTSGTRTLTATYAGNSSFAGSSTTDQHTVNAPPPATTATAISSDSRDPSAEGYLITSLPPVGTGTRTITAASMVPEALHPAVTLRAIP